MSDETKREPLDRRRFLKVVGVAGAGTAALSGCSTDKVEKLIPYLVQSQDQVPSLPTIYASTCAECAAGCGVHVRTREARAIKLEGNPEHPVNAGTLCARGQASLQGLYNPDRLAGPLGRNALGKITEILPNEAVAQLAAEMKKAGTKVAVVTGAGAGTMSDLIDQWTAAVGGRVIRYQAFDQSPVQLAAKKVFGVDEQPRYDFAAAKYIVSFGADFLETWGAPVEHQRGFAEAHGFVGNAMAKFVYVGPRMSLTGMNADQWVAPVPGTEVALALGMANAVLAARGAQAPADAGSLKGLLAAYTPEKVAQETGLAADVVKKLIDGFVAASPSLAVAGGIASQHRGAVDLAAAVHLLNYVAGNVGRTVHFGAGMAGGQGYGGMVELERAMGAGEIDLVIFHETNPLYTLPKSGGFAAALGKVRFKVSTSLFLDETAAACDLVIPNLHPLERWDDSRPRAGVHGLMQPVMEQVFKNVATGDALIDVARRLGGAVAAALPAPNYEAHLKAKWAEIGKTRGAADFDSFWRAALAKGGLYDAVPAPAAVKLAAGAAELKADKPALDGDGEFVFAPFPTAHFSDGRGANRPWLLENPDPVTKITWQSWIEVNPATAKKLDVREGEILKLVSPAGSLEASVYVYAGLREDVLASPLGLGHTEYGRYAKGRGVNALDLLAAQDGQGFLPYLSTKVKVEKTGRYRKVAKTEGNPRELGRGITESIPLSAAVKGLTIQQAYQAAGKPEHEVNPEREVEAITGFREGQLDARKYGAYALDNAQWGLVVDLARCTGCSACVTACYAENNIPWVGEDDIFRGREISWMRIERYVEGGEDGEPFKTKVIPVMCQQCDNAPCEPVCPVYAAYHTADGLNGQVYNRCVGTRYCANNCPYKVRYYNWYAYAKKAFVEPFNLQLNPDVTVRARGVMEKCTFCIQRIRGAQNAARLEDRQIADGEIVTACAQACPSGAITFGNLKDPAARVTKAAKSPRGYHVLEEVNTRPAVTYLARVEFGSEA